MFLGQVWSATYEMIKRHSEIEPVITELCVTDDDFNMLSLTLHERNLILGGDTVPDKESIISKITAVHEVTLILQRNFLNLLADFRKVFDYTCWRLILLTKKL